MCPAHLPASRGSRRAAPHHAASELSADANRYLPRKIVDGPVKQRNNVLMLRTRIVVEQYEPLSGSKKPHSRPERARRKLLGEEPSEPSFHPICRVKLDCRTACDTPVPNGSRSYLAILNELKSRISDGDPFCEAVSGARKTIATQLGHICSTLLQV